MTSREQFEAWLKSTGQNPPYATKRGFWEIWKASRESVEVEAPKFVESRDALSKGFTVDYSNGFGDAMGAYELSLSNAGIKVKP